MAEEKLKELINDVSQTDGYVNGWVEDYQNFEENLRVLTGVSFVTRNSRNSR